MDFLQLADKSILIFGVANRKSVAWHISRVLAEAGARCVYVVQNQEMEAGVAKLLGGETGEIYVCDVEHEDQIVRLKEDLALRGEIFSGLVHCIAFAD
ncbi:MAG: SDR family oxidoreductase, partial [Thermoguttaceae bacterium]